ncbi:hypothetical protein [Poritiphilus flavus]|uniref:Uncharacterized protein n=1 Tax=Poritiphilus flavus TaxID=2697053 RepID=A0A6L9EG45_9FLAO|nr:hypothetical protein [Poritiphilus flavus]NAS13705.1 hypothetical protein [Poritiphilus flavus]
MRQLLLVFAGTFLLSCNSTKEKITTDQSRHVGLTELETTHSFKTLYSNGAIDHAEKQTALVHEAYEFLSKIMGPKEEFCLLVVAGEDWEKNAYSPVVGMPEYYKGNLIVGTEKNEMALGYGEMIKSMPEEMTVDLIRTYINDEGELDMGLFFDKLSIHELTHNFQDPKNQEGYSMSRWLEEIHANMGLYAFYKTKRPEELQYVMHLVDFSLENPPPALQYSTLEDFDTNYFTMDPANYGQYQMRFTKAGQMLIDSLGNSILKPLNDFLIKYDESYKDKLTEEEFREKLATEVDPYVVELMDSWE